MQAKIKRKFFVVIPRVAARSAQAPHLGRPSLCAPVSRKGWVTPSLRLLLDSAFGLLASTLEGLAEPELVHDLNLLSQSIPVVCRFRRQRRTIRLRSAWRISPRRIW